MASYMLYKINTYQPNYISPLFALLVALAPNVARCIFAEAVAYKINHDATTRRFGLSVALDRPLLSELAKRYVDAIPNSREQTRAKRGLADFCGLLASGLCVDEVTKPDCKKYIDKRRRDDLKQQ